MSGETLYVAKDWKDRKLQQALLQSHKPEHQEILREYQEKKAGGATGGQAQNTVFAGSRSRTDTRLGSRPGLRQKPKRTVVDVPQNKLGRKLLLDSR